MPRGVYKRTEEHCAAIRKGLSSPEVRRKLSIAGRKNRGIKHPSMAGENNPAKRSEVREKISKALRNPSVETRRKMGDAKRGDKNPNKKLENRKKLSAAGKRSYLQNPERCLVMRKVSKLLWSDPEFVEKQRKWGRERWQDPEFIAKQIKSRGVKPNKPEKFLNRLLQKLFPNQWKYVGDFQKWIGSRCPDFISVSGQKKIIEHFGDFHHGEGRTGVSNEQHEQERIDYFAKYGYQTLIIWEPELENIELLTEKLLNFGIER